MKAQNTTSTERRPCQPSSNIQLLNYLYVKMSAFVKEIFLLRFSSTCSKQPSFMW